MKLENLENRLAELEKKKSVIAAQEKKLKSQLSSEKRKKENHTKMVLGGAVFGVLKDHVPTDRKELDLYGRALKAVLQNENLRHTIVGMIDAEYQTLKIEQMEPEDIPEETPVQLLEDNDSSGYSYGYQPFRTE